MLTSSSILKKISDAGLVGRGGAAFPVAAKWAAVKAALVVRPGGYIILNGAEGEPGVQKDGYIIQHYPAEVVTGLYLADRYLGPAKIKKIYIFLNQEYFTAHAPALRTVLAEAKYRALAAKVEFAIKPESLTYISGEETALLNLLEGKKIEPRLRPPYPTERGLFGRPTLINNTETFYDVSLVAQDRYEEQRFYTIGGAVKRRGVYALAANLSVAEVLRQTNNWPEQPFFVQVGGGASGEVLNSQQLLEPVTGTGSILVYDQKSTDQNKLLKYWLKFYQEQSCGKCTICREGTYRLAEMASQPSFDHKLWSAIINGLSESSCCALGASLPVPLTSYFNNIKN
jgi:NADH:ubiquinone oxidoreductase subunit F (NADH-binding)